MGSATRINEVPVRRATVNAMGIRRKKPTSKKAGKPTSRKMLWGSIMRLAIFVEVVKNKYSETALLDPLCRSARKKASRALSSCSFGGVRKDSVYPDFCYSLGLARGIRKCRGVDNFGRIEENEVSSETFPHQSKLREPKALRGHTSHFVVCFR